MSLTIEGIPQRESIPDTMREKLKERMKKKGEDDTMLPITPATIIAYGRIGGGKSSIMYSWLKNMFPRYYDECLIFCGSSDSKEAFEALPQKCVVFLNDYDDAAFSEYIDKLKEHQTEALALGERPLNVFIGLDDIVFSQAIGGRGKASTVERLMLICRHELNATVFICVQHSKQVNPAMRNNTIYNLILPLQKNDLEKVADEHAGHLSKDEFLGMYYEVMGHGPHQFICVDYKAPESHRFRHNWDKIISFDREDAPETEEKTLRHCV